MDEISFVSLNTTKNRVTLYFSLLPKTEQIHLATFNVGGLPPIVDVIKDVRPAKEKMKEFAQWTNRQKEEDLSLGIGLQEAFDLNESEIFTNDINDRYGYAVKVLMFTKLV